MMPPQSCAVDDVNTLSRQADREGDLPRVYFDSQSQSRRPQHNPRNSRWDLLGGARKFVQAYEQFEPRNASEQHLFFADGDLSNSKFVCFYQFLLSTSIVIRWMLFIIPVLANIWIPGILGITAFQRGEIQYGECVGYGGVYGWSVVWGGRWAYLAGMCSELMAGTEDRAYVPQGFETAPE